MKLCFWFLGGVVVFDFLVFVVCLSECVFLFSFFEVEGIVIYVCLLVFFVYWICVIFLFIFFILGSEVDVEKKVWFILGLVVFFFKIM